MDPITAIGLASAIITFVDFGSKIVRRLEELSAAGEVPKVFREIRTRLPLIITTIDRTRDAAKNLSRSAEEALSSVVESCYSQVKQLEEILQRFTAEKGESSWRKGFKATLSIMEETKVQRIESALRENVQILTLFSLAPDESSKRADLQQVIILPFERDMHLVGRENVLSSIGDLFKKQRRVAITGIGGVGKSQIAIEYCYQFMKKTPDAHVFWVYGGNPSRFYQGYKQIARDLALPSWDDPDTDTVELVLNWFGKPDRPYLLVIDNADSMADYWPRKLWAQTELGQQPRSLSACLPDINDDGFLLVTSRDNRIGGRLMRKGKPIVIEPLTLDEAKCLFQSRFEDHEDSCNDSDMERLLTELDCLPLAVTQAAAFISENSICIPEYLAVLEGDDAFEFLDEEMNDSRRDEESMNSVLRTWKLSFDQIMIQKPRAADLLSLMAMFDRQSIPKILLQVPETTTSLGTLLAFNLISSCANASSFQMHRLVQRFVQFSLVRSETVHLWQELAITALAREYPTHVGVSDWPVCENLTPHVQAVLTYQLASETAQLERGHLLCWAADYDVERGLYDQAFQRAEESTNIFDRFVPGTDPRAAAAQWQVGRLQYDHARSESHLNSASVALNRALQDSHKPGVIYADTAFELAHLYYEQNDTEKSVEMAEACWTSYQALLGPNDVRVLDNMHDHALKLAMCGRVQAGIKMWQDILTLCDASNASTDTRLIFSFRSLAGIAEFQGDSQMAEIFYQKLIILCERILSPDHVHVFDYRLSLAEQVMRDGRLDEAEKITQSILTSSGNKYEWRITASCLEMIAEIHSRKQLTIKEEHYRSRCLDVYQDMLGTSNNETTDAMVGLARVFAKNQKHAEAQTRKGVALARQLNDPDAEATFSECTNRSDTPCERYLNNLCAVLWNQGKWKELEDRSRQALDLEGDSPIFKRYLEAAVERQGRVEEALAIRTDRLELKIVDDSWMGRRQVEEPPIYETEDLRFGRIIHPRVYSS
ncbi:hypothetical protein MMC25_005245 [Agyrium rufum]|nr:hypothetical protein [Agyrium rufum]